MSSGSVGVAGKGQGRREVPGFLEAWLRGRSPSPPEPLLRLLLEEGGDGPVVGSVLADRGVTAFLRALAAPGRVRRSALHLLAGDAFLTYACELAAQAADVEGELKAVLARVAEGLPLASSGEHHRDGAAPG